MTALNARATSLLTGRVWLPVPGKQPPVLVQGESPFEKELKPCAD